VGPFSAKKTLLNKYQFTNTLSTLGMLMRRGAGGMKHVETNNFWLQNVIASKIVNLYKVPTEDNVADILTKYLTSDKLLHLSNLMRITRMQQSVKHRQ